MSTTDPVHAIAAKRWTIALVLSVLMLAIYFGFILLVAFAPGFLGASLTGGVTTVGIVIGVLVIILAFALTGFYVSRANGAYDTLTREIIQESSK